MKKRIMFYNADDGDLAKCILAGNSIVVNVLFHLFRKMVIETGIDKGNEPQQLSLF
jgi:hypothetical protein